MTPDEKKELILKSISHYGIQSQFDQFHEEIGELMTSINHFKRNRCSLEDVIVEMIDVEQMINALKLVYEIPEDLYQTIEEKQYQKLKENMEKK